jgi:hypothetical protein
MNSPLSDADWLLLEQFADGQMGPADQAAFDARLLTDLPLREALAHHQSIVAGIRAEGRAALRQRLQRLDAALGPPSQAPMRLSRQARWGRLAAAATVVLAAGLGVALLRPTGTQELVARYGVPDPGLPVLMSEEIPPTRALINQAMNAYKLGDYPTALATWRQLPAGAVGKDTMLYYTGIFQLSDEQSDEAAAVLAEVRKLPASAFRLRADYYFALSLWGQGRTQEAREALARLASQTNHPYADAARQTLPHLTE